ncbi:MAG: Hcp family type VI secretion system effector [Rhodocyclaceae bacterium]
MSSHQDFFVKIQGIQGESKDAKHRGWIDVLSWAYGVSQSASTEVGGGGGVGRAHFSALTFIHEVDRSSPNLMQYCAAGKHIDIVELVCCKAGDGPQEYIHLYLEDCLITRVTPFGKPDSARVLEGVAISFAKIRIETREQRANGSMTAAITGTWDIKRNVA